MTAGERRYSSRDRSRSRLGLVRFAWVMIAVALFLGVSSIITGSESIYPWANVSFCLLVAAVFFVIGVRESSDAGRGMAATRSGRTRDTLLVLAAVVAVLSPAVKFVVDLGEAVLPVAHQDGECKAAPVEPPSEAPRS